MNMFGRNKFRSRVEKRLSASWPAGHALLLAARCRRTGRQSGAIFGCRAGRRRLLLGHAPQPRAVRRRSSTARPSRKSRPCRTSKWVWACTPCRPPSRTRRWASSRPPATIRKSRSRSDFLADIFSDEVFVYGGPGFNQTIELFQRTYSAVQFNGSIFMADIEGQEHEPVAWKRSRAAPSSRRSSNRSTSSSSPSWSSVSRSKTRPWRRSSWTSLS